MDLYILRIALTVLGFVCFLGICIWAYSGYARKGFDEAAMIPFTDDDKPVKGDDGHLTQGKRNG